MANLSDAEKTALAAAGDSTDRIKDLSGSLDVAAKATAEFSNQTNFTSEALGKLSNWASEAGISLEKMGDLSGPAATKFGLFTAFLIGATPHFQALANLDSGPLTSFNTQFKSLLDTVSQQGTGLGIATEAGKKLVDMLGKMGVAGKDMAAVIKMGGKGLAAFAKNVTTGADNVLRLQGTMFKAMAAAGNMTGLYDGLGGSFKGVGEQLQNTNDVLGSFTNIMKDSSIATGRGLEEMGKYQAAMLSMPAVSKGLLSGVEAMSNGIDVAGTHMNALTSIIQLADGTGMDANEMFQDINKTMASFNVGFTDARSLVARYVDVSADLGAQMKDVREAIIQTTDRFRLFALSSEEAANMNQGLTDSVKNWAGALEKAGVPAQNALKLAQNYTTSMESMTEAQESFVNQQTGGEGGLLGALQFEDLIRKSPTQASAKIAEAMKQQMTRAGFGSRIISREEGIAGGQGGAAQYEYERQLAMSGQFGIKAQSKEEADAMIMALQKGGDISKSVSEGDKEKAETTAMARGKQQEELTNTGFKQATITAEYASLQAGNINLGFLEKTFGARSGTDDEGANLEGRALLRRRINDAETVPSTGATSTVKDAGILATDADTYAKSVMNSILDQVSGSPNTTVAPPTKERAKTSESSAADYEKKRQFLMSGPKPQAKSREEADAMIKAMAAHGRPQAAGAAGGQSIMVGPKGKEHKLSYTPIEGYSAGKLLGRSATAATTSSTTASGTRTRVSATSPQVSPMTGGANQPVPVTLVGGQSITLNFTCPNCGNHVRQQSNISDGTNTPAGARH